MNLKLKSYLTILIFLAIGMLVLGTYQFLKVADWLNSDVIVLTLFIVINIAAAAVFSLKTEIKTYWSFKKIYFLPIGIVAGGLIAVIPTIAGVLLRVTSLSELKFDTTFTVTSIALTLAIVAWEELWFRGIFLNYCSRNLSAISISVIIGFCLC